MTIASLQAKPFNVRLRRPFSFFAYTLKALPYALVSITTREGIRGIGEAALAWDVTGETQPGALAVTKLLKGVVEKKHIDSVDDVKDILEEINGAVFGNTGLKTALESALLDALGQEKQKPIFRLLKASPKKSVTFQKTFSFEELDAAIGDIAQQYASQGVSVFKFKIGKNAERELRALQKVRRACPKATLTLDGNQAWRRYQEAQRFLDKTKPMHIAWVEQPLHWDDTDGLAKLRAAGFVIMVDESCHAIADVRRLAKARALDLVNMKLAKCGGLFALKEMIQFCEKEGIGFMLGDMIHSPVGTAYNLHAATLGNFLSYDLTLPNRLHPKEKHIGKGLVFKGCTAQIPQGPGLGVTM